MTTRYIFLAGLVPLGLAGAAGAEEFRIPAPPESAIVYPLGASVTRTAEVDLPAGRHRVLIPAGGARVGEDPPRIEATGGITVGAVSFLPGYVTDPEEVFSPAQSEAQGQIDTLEDRIEAAVRDLAEQRADVASAEARIAFLRSLSAEKVDGIDGDSLAQLSGTLGSELAQATRDLAAATPGLAEQEDALEELQKQLAQARRRFNELSPPAGAVDMLAVEIMAEEAGPATLTLTALSRNASWTPVYDLRLDRDTGTLDIARKALVSQGTGEAWQDVELTLSTADPYAQVIPTEPWQNQASIHPPYEPRATVAGAAEMDMAPAPVMEGTREMKASGADFTREAASAEISGLSVTYAYPEEVTVGSGGDPVQLALDVLELEADPFARAVPRIDQTAYLLAEFTNDEDEPILPGEAALYVDGTFSGRSRLPLIAAGAEEELSFGPLDGIRLEYRQIRNDTGDVGLVSRSNTRRQTLEYDVQNLTGAPQDVQTLIALPYSEQEDLDIDLRIEPRPDAENWEDQRGIDVWNLTLAPGETRTITVTATLSWPQGQELSWQP
ncbi:mucoidy inhibitor MuiA family protein [Roseicyclus sp. F158]|uniref:Mucoidy inhibitor MuiA family protein n=1 Tax=Tropicimonas omnivorans TaxID=3075590 RepID=A0ABU3DBF5_9RHOB|nr:mucoidy inhibitor MuiA family protein [Roseicyclus sp. F158]MDT0681054.1 mucoidy inhibitor MuiA family protein [Roseicyclus sp. F158]